jgi:uncharacterized protein (TIGR00369 family)
VEASVEQERRKPGLGPPLSEGEWTGWSLWNGREPFEDLVGPYYARRNDDGRLICGCRVQTKQLNGAGAINGGALASFADYTLFQVAFAKTGHLGLVTVTLNTEFVASARAGALLIGRAGVVKAGGSLLFLQGSIDTEGEPVLSVSGVLKALRPRSA